ncbi:putative sulphydryl oxidase protein [Paramyrothecium foliicola]|nr:putative sulphydryl oxidase protein [Paramyrothecium foliicola]
MRFSALPLVVSGLVSHVLGAAIEPRNDTVTVYDAIIVGGGPAGLATLSSLVRVNRHVLLLDSGSYRNGPTRHMHDVLGFDGVTPAYYRWAAREQISHYETAEMANATVTKIEPESGNKTFKVYATYPKNDKKTFVARKIVLATGLKDILPKTPGIVENWGKGIYWCPWCDGQEHSNQPLGLLASLDDIPGLVREISTLNKDIVAFVNGTDTAKVRTATDKDFPKWQKYLEIHNVTVENRTLAAITRLKDGTTGKEDPSLPTVAEHDLFRVSFENSTETVERAAFFVSFPNEQRSKVGKNLGVKVYGNGRYAVDESKGSITNVPGIYAVGDCNSDNSTNVYHALYSGKRAAVFLHVQLGRESSAAELGEVAPVPKLIGRSDQEVIRELWDEMNGEPGDLLYAGKFKQ